MSINNILAVTISYVLGSFMTGYYLIKIKTKQDIRTLWGKSAGARNVGHVLGTRGFVITFVGDVLKGLIALSISRYLKVELWVLMASVLATVIGHIWPFQLNFKGGQGLSPALGAVLVFDYRIVLGYFIFTILLSAIIRKLDAGGLIALISVPVVSYFLGYPITIVLGMLLLVCIIILAHRPYMADIMSRKN